MNIRDLAEEWVDYAKQAQTGVTYGIHRNPTSKDYADMRRENGTKRVRYIVSLYSPESDLNLYVFDANLLHYEAAKKLGIPYKSRVHLPIWGDYGFGESDIVNNKLTLTPGILVEISRMGRNFPVDFLRTYFLNVPEPPEKKSFFRKRT